MPSNGDARAILVKCCPSCGREGAKHWSCVPDKFEGGTGVYELVQCPECSHIWLGNPPAPEEMGHYYGPDYHRTISQGGETAPGRWKRHLRIISKYKTAGSILDIGCSSGSFLSTLKGGPWKLHGVEPSLLTGEKARAATGGEIFIGDVLTANFPPDSFDVITCFDVFEHLYEPRKVLLEIFKWLKWGGIFYVFSPNIMSWESRVFRSHWFGLDLPRHLQHFSPKSIGYLAASVGLRRAYLVTPSESHLEHSVGGLVGRLTRKAGCKPWSPDAQTKLSLPLRILRKGLRLSVFEPLGMTASLFGAGACIEGVFQKCGVRDSSREVSPGLVGSASSEQHRSVPIFTR